MKWINQSNVQFYRGNYEPCIFKFDNSKVWFSLGAICTTQTVRYFAREMGKHYNAKYVTMKYLFDANGKSTENRNDVVDVDDYNGQYHYRIELPVKGGEKRQFKSCFCKPDRIIEVKK